MPHAETLFFPEKLMVRVVDSNTNEPVPNIAVILHLKARAKNDYDLGPPMSDTEGKILIERDWVRQAVDRVRNTALMDYVSTMEQCFPDTRIIVMSQGQIDKAVAAMRIWGIEEGDIDVRRSISDLQRASNKDFAAKDLVIRLDKPDEKSREVTIALTRIKF